MLELALNNGISRLKGDEIGPKTGDPKKFKSYDEVWRAYRKQVTTFIKKSIIPKNFSWQLISESLQVPFQSSLFEGCIEKGTDVTQNGTAPYTTIGMWVTGIPNVGDSLAAIKKAVFEDKKITMPQLIHALDSNFKDRDDILNILRNAPKFGNDDDYVDSIVSEVHIHISHELSKCEGFGNVKYTLAAGSVNADTVFGKSVGALPDGRKAELPLSDGGISPYYGRDINGPTSTMRSVAKLDLVKSSGGNVLNMKFHPDLLKDESKMRRFALLIRTFGESGGDLVQFNIVSGDILREAQKNPEKYRDLLVRVATYSAYFVELGEELQNQIIARTEFQEV
jgi:formate C-acetyltransferase